MLSVTASPNSVSPGGTSIITADLNHDNTGASLTGGQLPDGIVTFSGDTLGSVNPTSAETINGVASTTFTAGTTTGDSNPAATVNAMTIPTTININVGGADVYVIKSFQDSNLNTITSANLGDLVYSNIQVTNSGPSTATGVLISDPTPTGLIYANIYNTGIGTFDPTTGWNIGTLENGATAILNIAYYVTGTGTITNTARATTTSTDPHNINNAWTTTLNIPDLGADVYVIKSFQDSNLNTITSANLGDLVYSNIQVTNSGPSTATGVLISDPTPTGLIYANIYNTGIGTFDPTTGWNIGTLENGATAILNIAYYVTGTGTITNTARATTTSTDPHNINNAWTTTLNIPNGADIGVATKILTDSWNIITDPKIGDYIITLVTVTNNGPDTATGITINNPTPTGLTYLNYYTTYDGMINWLNNDGTYNPTTGWTINSIANGATYTIKLVYQITGIGTITNTATKTTETQTDPNTTNDQSTTTITVPGVDTADISVTTKILTDSWNIITNPKIGDYIITLVTVTNNGPDTATGITINNPTPTGLTYLNYYTTYDGMINWLNNDGTYNPTTGWTINSITKGATYTIKLVYQITGIGTITNTATKTTETQTDPNTTNDQSTTTITVPGVNTADISVTTKILTDSWNIITNPKIGDYIITLVTVTNNGPDTATGITINNPTPTGLTYLNTYSTTYDGMINWLNNDGTYNPTTGWTINSITKGATYTIELVYQITGIGTITNTATKTTETQTDPNTTNDQSTTTITVPGVNTADISVTTKILNDSWNIITNPKIGDYIITLVTVTNNGPDTATGITINNPTPTGLTYLNTYSTTYDGMINWLKNDGTYNPTTGWTINSITKGATYTIKLVYQITGIGTITNTATKTTETQTDPNTTNDQSTTSITV